MPDEGVVEDLFSVRTDGLILSEIAYLDHWVNQLNVFKLRLRNVLMMTAAAVP